LKLEALDHPKTLHLASLLQVEIPTAIGYLELFWAFVAKKTPQGDVGKWPDGVIAHGSLWRGPACQFVEALVTARFVDVDTEHRLIVHDWAQHCPNWVRAKLKKDRVEFALKSPLKSDSYDGAQETTGEVASAPSSRADLNQGKGRQEKGSAPGVRNVSHGTLSPEFEAFMIATYPETGHPTDFVTAHHSAMGLVGMGHVTEDVLRQRLIGFRAFVQARGYSDSSKVPAPQNWFNPNNPRRYWANDWKAPPTKADQQQDANMDAAQRFLARQRGTA
jgi:hypothetical protein